MDNLDLIQIYRHITCFYKGHLTVPAGATVLTRLNLFSDIPGTLDISFIRQWQTTLFICNGILLPVNATWLLLNLSEEDQDWTQTIIYSISMALIVVGLIKTYIKEFVNLDKI